MRVRAARVIPFPCMGLFFHCVGPIPTVWSPFRAWADDPPSGLDVEAERSDYQYGRDGELKGLIGWRSEKRR